MASVLVLVEHTAGEPKKVTYELLTKARELGEPAAVFLGGQGSYEKAKDSLAEYGARTVYVAESADFDDYLVAPKAEVLATIAREAQPAAVLVPASSEGKEIAARTAVKLGAGYLADVTDLAADLTATQHVFGGATIVSSQVATGVPVIAVRPNSFPAVPAPATPEDVRIEPQISPAAKAAKIVERVSEQKSARPELSEASIVVSGGRGLGSAEQFALVEQLADALGGAVGASRAATDAGWYPHQYQVGQTGKTVSPQVYVAVGISGAIQHRAGMQTSKTIVAINKDPEAPIFEIADFGVVGDLFSVVPQLTEEVRKRKG